MDYIITTTDGENYLAHHGVKGMRWGIRKVRSTISKIGERSSKSPNAGTSKRTDKHKGPSAYDNSKFSVSKSAKKVASEAKKSPNQKKKDNIKKLGRVLMDPTIKSKRGGYNAI